MFHAMKIYTVHIKPGMENTQTRPVFVSEGFNIWAFVFTLLWALYQRVWFPAIVVIAFNALVIFMLKDHVLGLPGIIAVNLGFHVLVGFMANDWLRARLARQGYILADISAGDNLLRAEQRYFDRILEAA